MMASRDSAGAVAGGLARHIPVLGRRAVELLDVRDHAVYIDATFGGGGHRNAAGFTMAGPLAAATQSVLVAVRSAIE